MQKLADKLDLYLRRLMFRRFETVELLLSVSLFVHGLWLMFPYWSPGGNPTEISRDVEVIGATLMIASGAIHVPLVIYDWRDRLVAPIRKVFSMSSFMGHAFLLVLAVLAVGLDSVLIVPYTILTLLGALAYLSMTVLPDE